MRNTGKVERRSISLYARDWKIVDEYGEKLGVGASPSVRAIVREWARSRALREAARDVVVSGEPVAVVIGAE